ncbi:limbin-like isoform X2 [Polyodon spathula]|uniref:limbin-like isoform X2 n=1 Tax=Polyodon spathula TaxID=7913 RepID=UPI001B7F45C4|nr:limbin-like isoform X2 [Polyodon spathula]
MRKSSWQIPRLWASFIPQNNRKNTCLLRILNICTVALLLATLILSGVIYFHQCLNCFSLYNGYRYNVTKTFFKVISDLFLENQDSEPSYHFERFDRKKDTTRLQVSSCIHTQMLRNTTLRKHNTFGEDQMCRIELGKRPILFESNSFKLVDDKGPVCFSSMHRRDHFYKSAYVTEKAVMSGSHEQMVEDPVLSLSSAAPGGPWRHSVFTLISTWAGDALQRRKRESSPGHKHIRSLAQASTFGLTFHKCGQVDSKKEFPTVSVKLVINNTGIPAATNISQLSIRDAVTGLTLQATSGNVLERGFQTFTKDTLTVGSYYTVKYTALLKEPQSGILALPAYLTFSNASQNDINLFGPLMANFTLQESSTGKIPPNHGIHFVGFLVAFIVSFVLVCLVLLIVYQIRKTSGKIPHQNRKKRTGVNGECDPEQTICNISETSKEEAAFEDKIIDILIFEDPLNMYQALDNLDMSNLLHTSASLESYRVQIYKDVIAKLLRNVKVRGDLSPLAEKRLNSVLNGQLMGMEGKLKEEHVARMAALAAECNLETREEMEAEHRRVTAEKGKAERLFQQVDQQVLEFSMLLDKLHKLDQSHLQHCLLVKHEEASANVQRQIVVCRRVELHKIFFEELEEATRMGELENNVANRLLHVYLTSQEQLEEVLDILLANQRYILGERHAHRQFLVHSLQSLKNLICEVFTKATLQLESFFQELKNDGYVTEDQAGLLLDKAKKQLLQVKQNLDEALNREKSALHCNITKKRRSQICEKVQEQKQKQKDLATVSKASEESLDLHHYLNCWQNLLISQCIEVGDLISNLDEEAAADIRKVSMRLIQSACSEIKSIQPRITQELSSLGAPRLALQHAGSKHQLMAGVLSEAQERLHKEGKNALKVLQKTRDKLQEQLELEMKEQQALRQSGRSVFVNLCKSQLTLSEVDLLKMKLEFQKCLSMMDNCLVLPRAQTRSRLQAYLSDWRKAILMKTERSHTVMQDKQQKSKLKKQPHEAKISQDHAEFLVLQKRIEEKMNLYEQEKEIENTAMKKVLVEMLHERAHHLKAQEDRLAVHMAALQFQKAEKRVRALEAYAAIVSLQTLLVEELRMSGSMTGSETVQMIQKHSHGLEDADNQLKLKESAEWDALMKEYSLAAAVEGPSSETQRGQEESQLAVSLQHALTKCQHVTCVQRQRLREEDAVSQVTEDLKEQLEFKRLHMRFDQDLEFLAYLVKQTRVPASVLLEVLHLLLPTSSETDLISIIDPVCPKPAQTVTVNDREKGQYKGSGRSLASKLREEIIRNNKSTGSLGKEKASILKKKQVQLLKQVSFSHLEHSNSPQGGGRQDNVDSTVEPAADVLHVPHTGEKVFVFRCKASLHDSLDTTPKKKKKRSFLNFKKSAVANSDLL